MARYPKGSTPKLTKELIEEISFLIKMGCYLETAAAAAVVSKDTLFRWLKNGKRGDGNCLEQELSDSVMRSFAEAEVRDLEVINQAAEGCPELLLRNDDGEIILNSDGHPITLKKAVKPDWKASAWRLERKFPEQWGRRKKTDVKIGSSCIEVVFA